MGAVDERFDARADGDCKRAFILSVTILDRKGSKRLMAAEIDECLSDLKALGKLELLPVNFFAYSVYGQRECLDKIATQL